MRKWINVQTVLSILSLNVIAACATSPTSQRPTTDISVQSSPPPRIPIALEDAFFPIHPSLKGVFYSWDECRFWGLDCDYTEVLMDFNNPSMMKWFMDNDYGFAKRKKP
jgi:hypothetical protein